MLHILYSLFFFKKLKLICNILVSFYYFFNFRHLLASLPPPLPHDYHCRYHLNYILYPFTFLSSFQPFLLYFFHVSWIKIFYSNTRPGIMYVCFITFHIKQYYIIFLCILNYHRFYLYFLLVVVVSHCFNYYLSWFGFSFFFFLIIHTWSGYELQNN